LNSNGSGDAGFTSDGKAFIPLGKPATEAATSPGGLSPAVAITDGKIIIAGGTLPPAKPSLFALARVQGVGATAPLATINSNGIIIVEGTSGNDRIEILQGASNNHTNPFVEVRRGNDSIDFPQSGDGVKGVSVSGSAGNDAVFMSVDLPATLHGGDGDDRLEANSNTNQIFGDNGNDTVQGGSGKDLIHGGAGNDLLDGFAGADDIFGDSGIDTVNYTIRTVNLTISLDNNANDGASGEHDNIHSDIENILGGSGNDRIVGSLFDNGLNGGAGNDTIYGGAGNDTITGGSGHDLLFGQDGNDRFFAEDGQKDSIDGGNGFDTAQRDHGSITDQITHVESCI
jgi:Ca2+-binding RTX toxin-like protein